MQCNKGFLLLCLGFLALQHIKDGLYHKIPKFSDPRKHCCDLPKIQTKTPNLREFLEKGANGIANSQDPDQTAPLGAV